jgi:hypothetical protein
MILPNPILLFHSSPGIGLISLKQISQRNHTQHAYIQKHTSAKEKNKIGSTRLGVPSGVAISVAVIFRSSPLDLLFYSKKNRKGLKVQKKTY